jgi:hypothetical protein
MCLKNAIIKIFYFVLNSFIFLVNIIVISINIKKKKYSLKLFLFKNIDNVIFSIASKSYTEISNYLNRCYEIKKDKKQKNRKRKKIKLYFVDFYLSFNYTKFMSYNLKGKYIIELNSDNPDYLIYSTQGKEHLNPKYSNAVKIAIFGENSIIDFEQADYGIGNHNIIYLDRYSRFSSFLERLKICNNNINFFSKIRERVLKNPLRKKFCAAVISNFHITDYFRLEFIKKLNLYKKVDMGGKFNNNVGGPVPNKIQFLSFYKFSIAMENTSGDGYSSEKIIDSFLSGTIPIYYGNFMVEEYINRKTYILIKGQEDIYKKIKYIKEIDNNDDLYKKILKENVIIEENIVKKFEKEKSDFLIHIFEQDKELAKRK